MDSMQAGMNAFDYGMKGFRNELNQQKQSSDRFELQTRTIVIHLTGQIGECEELLEMLIAEINRRDASSDIGRLMEMDYRISDIENMLQNFKQDISDLKMERSCYVTGREFLSLDDKVSRLESKLQEVVRGFDGRFEDIDQKLSDFYARMEDNEKLLSHHSALIGELSGLPDQFSSHKQSMQAFQEKLTTQRENDRRDLNQTIDGKHRELQQELTAQGEKVKMLEDQLTMYIAGFEVV